MKKKLSGMRVLICYLGILGFAVGCMLANTILFSRIKKEVPEEPEFFSRHYALITETAEDRFWHQVYDAASEYAEEKDACVEWFGQNQSGSSTVEDLLRIAIDAGVDGIILQASDEEETKALVERSQNRGIPVVTVLSDCQDSSRLAYIGVNNYDIGQLYGEEVMKLICRQFKKNIRIMIAAGGDAMNSSQNLTLMGLREYVNDHLPEGYYVEFTTELISQNSSFATEEYFNNLFVSGGKLPDVLICLDEGGTRCSYLAAVDHNRVGETKIIGYYYSKDILTALEKGIFDAVLSVDAEAIGRGAAEALMDYQEYGYTNSYRTAAVRLLGQEDAAFMLKQKEEEETE